MRNPVENILGAARVAAITDKCDSRNIDASKPEDDSFSSLEMESIYGFLLGDNEQNLKVVMESNLMRVVNKAINKHVIPNASPNLVDSSFNLNDNEIENLGTVISNYILAYRKRTEVDEEIEMPSNAEQSEDYVSKNVVFVVFVFLFITHRSHFLTSFKLEYRCHQLHLKEQ